jgi:AAA+ superfamily predicted ATPase
MEWRQDVAFELGGFSYVPIDCEPVLRGIVAAETNVIVFYNEKLQQEKERFAYGYLVSVTVVPANITPNHIGYTSWKNMAQSGFFDGDWIEITSGNRTYWIQIFGSDDFKDDAIHLARAVWSFVSLAKTAIFASKIDVCSIKDVPIANKLVLSRISTPDSQNQVIYNGIPQALKEYFQQDQLVMPDMIFEVPVDYTTQKFLDMTELSSPHLKDVGELRLVYFKVVELEPKGICRVDSNKTQLMETLGIQSYLPNLEQLAKEEFVDIFEELEQQIQVSLHQKALECSLFTSILLHGASGCGKKTLLEIVAKRNGLHVLTLNCYVLIQDTVEKTATELNRYIDVCKKASPCILILRNFEALCESWTGSDASPDAKSFLNLMWSKLSLIFKETGYPVILTATCTDIDLVNKELIRLFSNVIKVPMPNESQRQHILEYHLGSTKISPLIDFRQLARETAGLSSRDLVSCVNIAGKECLSRAIKYNQLMQIV